MFNKEKKIFRTVLMLTWGAILLTYSPSLSYAQYTQVIDPYGNINTYVDNYSTLTITTTDATAITSSGATLNGLVNGNNLYNTQNLSTWFEYGTSTDLGYSTIHSNSNSGYANFSANLANLIPDTTYYFRAIGQSPRGVVYGIINAFRTDFAKNNPTSTTVINSEICKIESGRQVMQFRPCLENHGALSGTSRRNYNSYYSYNTATLSATTNPATAIANESVEMNALITNPGSNIYKTDTWFEWGTSSNLGNKTETISVKALPLFNHTDTVLQLAPGTTYYFRAVAENSYYHRVNGDILSFTTEGSSGSGGSALGASVIGSGSFFPDSILGWILLIILILILMLLGKHLYRDSLDKRLESQGHA